MSTIFLFAVASLSVGVIESSGGTPPVGASVADFELTDGRGGVRHLTDWSGSRIVCFVFLRTGCPVAELYATPLASIAERFHPRGVAFVGISTDRNDDPAGLARYATAHGIGFPILMDGGEVSTRLGATRTPEVVVLDDRRRIRYRGRIDDRYAVASRRNEARGHDLVAALEDLLEGREVGRPQTEAVGCPIDRPAIVPDESDVTYCRDVAPILDRRCVSCHRPGQIGPFSLQTYRGAASRAAAIAEAVEEQRMPPWHADPRYGKFANDGRLTDREKEQILGWTRHGCPEGDPADLPKPIDHPIGWRIPEPDLVVSMTTSYTVPAQGVVDYQSFEVDPGFREDRWIRGAEIRPGNRKVVHHCNVFLKAPRSRGDADIQGDLESYCLAATTPGAPPLLLPEGMAKRIPAGWRLVFVVHYSPIGIVQEDRTSIGLLFADPASVKKEVATNLILDPDLRIPPHEANHRVEQVRRFESDVLLLSMFPHMHLRGKSFRYEAIFPDGRKEILLDVPRYDFNWQNRYELDKPRRLPAGTTLRCIAHYDNSGDNPANPDPAATVLTGQQSWEEMFNGYYDIALADQDLTRKLTWFEVLSRALKRFSVPASILAFAGCGVSLLLIRWRGRNRAKDSQGPKMDGFPTPTASMVQPMPEEFVSDNSRSHRGLSAIPWVAGFGLCALPVFFVLLNHDVAWMLLAADRVLAGQRLYVDVVEVNPPLIIWLNFAPVLAARTLEISQILSFRLIMLSVLAGSILLSRWTLVREHPEEPAVRRPVLILAIMALLPVAGYDFGQREHLMLALFFPYLLLASARAKGRPMGLGMPWIIGLVAGAGIALKPQFLPLWIAIEAYLAWARRDWHAWFRPEALAVTAVGVSYGITIVSLTPEYLSMARWALPLYARCVQASFSSLVSEPATMITAVASLGFLAIRPQGEHRERCRLLLIADLSLLAIAFIQDKGFTYHFYPPMATGMILIGLLAMGRRDPESHLPRYSLLMTRGLLAFLVLNASASRVGDSLLWRGCPAESDTIVGRMIRLSRDRAPSGSIFTFSPAVAASFPMVFYGEVRWASRYPCLQFLPALYPEGLPPGRALAKRTSGEMGQTERFLLTSVVDDLLRERPTLLFVDEMENKPAFHGRPFDFLEYYSIDPRFIDFLRDYERITKVDLFGVYRRKDPMEASLFPISSVGGTSVRSSESLP